MKQRGITLFLLVLSFIANANGIIANALETPTTSASSPNDSVGIAKKEFNNEISSTLDSDDASLLTESTIDSYTEEATTSSSEQTKMTETSIEESNKETKKEPKEKAPLLAVNEIEVGTWTDFVNAIRNETINKITLISDFDNPGSSDGSLSTYQRKSDLEIDGQRHRVDFKNSSIRLGDPTAGSALFHMHDIVLNQNYVGASSEDIVGTRLNYTYAAKWKYRFGNITTEPGVQRLARASHSEVTVYGDMKIDTRAENFYLGSLIMEDGTQYKGNVNNYNFSVFWYNVAADATSTGASREFTVGKNCTVSLGQTQTTGRTYPAVFSHYLALTIGENSIFNVDMPGNAVRFDDKGSGMTIKSGAKVNLTSKQPAGSIVAFSEDNTYLNVEPDSFFYVIGTSNQPLINLSANGTGTGNVARTGNSFTLNKPAKYDLRNLDNTQAAVNVASKNAAANKFSILNSDIDLWKIGIPVLGPSTETYAQVKNLDVTGNGTKEVVATSETGLNSFMQTNYRRISGMNQDPEVEWTPVTDADKTIKARVMIGRVPDNNGLVNGNIVEIPVYASKNQAEATIIDTHDQIREQLWTDENGYASYTDTDPNGKFQLADEEIVGVAFRGPWTSDINSPSSKTKVIDATPPEPAKVDNADAIQSTTKKITGTGEPDSLVTLTLNGQPTSVPEGIVGADGKWQIDLTPISIKTGDILQIFLQDQSGFITELSDADRPVTNDPIGNINPKNDMTYRDAVFKAATKITVVGNLSLSEVPDKVSFGTNQVVNKTANYQPIVSGKLMVSDTRGGAKKPWRLTVCQSEELSNGSISLADGLFYTSQLGKKKITASPQIVETGELATDGSMDVSAQWTGEQGFKLTVPTEKQRIGEYKGKLSWRLEDVPGN